MQRGHRHFYIEGSVVDSSAARDYIQAAVPRPSGAAQDARNPAGTLGPGDIQAVT